MSSRSTAPGREDAFFFESDGGQLFGTLHTPSARDTACGLIFCDPFGEEKEFVHRTFVNFARRLCREGFHVLRFDYRGSGESSGSPDDASMTQQLGDIACAIDLMVDRSQVRDLGLLGLRLGGTLAALAADRDPRISHLVLWAPALKPVAQLDQALRRTLVSGVLEGGRRRSREQLMAELRTDGRIEIDGYFLGRQSYSEFAEVDLGSFDWSYRGDLLAIDITSGSSRPDPETERLCRRLGESGCRSELKVVGEQPFWSALRFDSQLFPHDLCEETTSWLTSRQGKETIGGTACPIQQ